MRIPLPPFTSMSVVVLLILYLGSHLSGNSYRSAQGPTVILDSVKLTIIPVNNNKMIQNKT